MKVKEIIELLNLCDKDSDVFFTEIDKDDGVFTINKVMKYHINNKSIAVFYGSKTIKSKNS